MEHPLVGRWVGLADVAPPTRALSNVYCTSPPRSILRFRQSDAHSLIHSFVRSFVCSLIAQKSIQGNVQNCHKEEEEKRGKEVRFESERRRRRENVNGIGIQSLVRSPAAIQKNRITLHTKERTMANFRSSNFCGGLASIL